MKKPFTKRCPYYITLPKDAKSPTDGIYKRYDIVRQGKVLEHLENSLTIRSSFPFTLQFTTKGKVKEVSSKSQKCGFCGGPCKGEHYISSTSKGY